MPPGPTDTYLGVCVWCGAKHEVGSELAAEERGCMCGGQVVPVDTLAQLAHRLWASWSMAVADEEPISDERRERWRTYWVPYGDLDDSAQATDREIVQEYLTGPPEYPE